MGHKGLNSANHITLIGLSRQSKYQVNLPSSSNAGVLVDGGNGTNTLEIATCGSAVMNADDKNLTTVQLDAATNLTMNAQTNLTALGSSGSDTITANGKN